jgi:hypothetical protein
MATLQTSLIRVSIYLLYTYHQSSYCTRFPNPICRCRRDSQADFQDRGIAFSHRGLALSWNAAQKPHHFGQPPNAEIRLIHKRHGSRFFQPDPEDGTSSQLHQSVPFNLFLKLGHIRSASIHKTVFGLRLRSDLGPNPHLRRIDRATKIAIWS